MPKMAAEQSFLVRGPDGRMSTVIARSVRGVLKTYLRKRRPPIGSVISVKLRGIGSWEDFKVTK
jgi:hypothetical protein